SSPSVNEMATNPPTTRANSAITRYIRVLRIRLPPCVHRPGEGVFPAETESALLYSIPGSRIKAGKWPFTIAMQSSALGARADGAKRITKARKNERTKTRKARLMSKHDALNHQSGSVEVEEQSDMQAGRFQV